MFSRERTGNLILGLKYIKNQGLSKLNYHSGLFSGYRVVERFPGDSSLKKLSIRSARPGVPVQVFISRQPRSNQEPQCKLNFVNNLHFSGSIISFKFKGSTRFRFILRLETGHPGHLKTFLARVDGTPRVGNFITQPTCRHNTTWAFVN